jgi:type IV pilus assembly protein PilE
VECAVTCAVAVLLAALAAPAFRGETLRAARLDAVQALTRLQLAQEEYRSRTGLYAADLAALRGVGTASAQGRYTLSLQPQGPEAFMATATPRGAQARDTPCPALTLTVSQGWATFGPTPQCWHR